MQPSLARDPGSGPKELTRRIELGVSLNELPWEALPIDLVAQGLRLEGKGPSVKAREGR